MSSKIEQLIDEIEDYIDNCRYQPLSKTNIIVNKEEIDELLRELRMKTPEEIKYYQKMLTNKEAILNDARAKAEALINEATVHTNELISEHEIMQQAYAQANEVVTLATHQAQEILDNATLEANGVRAAAVNYLDEMLANLENLMTNALSATTAHYDSFFNTINDYNEVVKANRAELIPQQVEEMINQSEYSNKTEKTEESVNLDLVQGSN
ncbi:MAG: vacuolar family H+-ATPase subunit H [Lachnospiraceae bacterium]|nr:vacuolar family H+-ATPase subunit H [Lachnospiraceae bacterium]